jgi:hypothetical protein
LTQSLSRSDIRALVWLALAVATGVAMALLYSDSYQQDGGAHYLFARRAWGHPENLVNVWSRPLFTFLFALPAIFGYQAAKLFAAVISTAVAWQTWRLAKQLQLRRPELVIPFLFLQPSFLLLCAETMTEPLFALALVIALRLHLSGRVLAAMMVASLLPLARPEGFFVCALWGLWILCDRRVAQALWQKLPVTLLLAGGTFLWAFAALWIVNDPLWLLHNWPRDWQGEGGQFGTGSIWWYVHKSSYIFGLTLKWPFIIGLLALLRQRKFLTGVAMFALIFGLHSLLFVRGTFNAAGYPRYLVCVSPAIALITLAGWNAAAGALLKLSRFAPAPVLSVLVLAGGIHALHYVDGFGQTRDARAINEMSAWFNREAAATHPVTRLMASEVYMRIVLDRQPWEELLPANERAAGLMMLRDAPPGTLIFWDDETGPERYKLVPADFEAAGYEHLRSQQYRLDGWFFSQKWKEHGGPRFQQLHLFYKPLLTDAVRFARAH